MPRRIITPQMADYIYRSYEALLLDGNSRMDAIRTLRSDIENDFKNQVSLSTIELYASKTFYDAKRIKKNNIKKKKNGLSEFSDSFRNFQKGEIPSISKDNRYFTVLSTLNKHDYPVKGTRISEDLGMTSVRTEMRVLGELGLIEHSSKVKYNITKTGSKYLKKVKAE